MCVVFYKTSQKFLKNNKNLYLNTVCQDNYLDIQSKYEQKNHNKLFKMCN